MPQTGYYMQAVAFDISQACIVRLGWSSDGEPNSTNRGRLHGVQLTLRQLPHWTKDVVYNPVRISSVRPHKYPLGIVQVHEVKIAIRSSDDHEGHRETKLHHRARSHTRLYRLAWAETEQEMSGICLVCLSGRSVVWLQPGKATLTSIRNLHNH
jgi:hypothetical protein